MDDSATTEADPGAGTGGAPRPQKSPLQGRSNRVQESNRVLLQGVVLGLLIIGLSIGLGTPAGASAASATLNALGGGDPTVGFLVLLVLVVLAASLLLALRDRVIARIGLRNIARAKGRTAILLMGLLVGSTIISSSLVIGDTVNTLTVHFTYVADGAVDEAVWAPTSVTAQGSSALSYAPIPASAFATFNASASQITNVAGVTPMLLGTASVEDLSAQSAQPGVRLVGVDAFAASYLGDFTTTSGQAIAGPTSQEVLLNPTAASELGASVGDHVLLAAGGATLTLTVGALVKADDRGGFQDAGQGDVFTTVGVAQNVTGYIGYLDYIGITNAGGLVGGPQYTNQVWPHLVTSLSAAQGGPSGIPPTASVHSQLTADLASARSSAQSLTQLFLVLGLFSIGAGAVLIVGIFTMLAEERRGEMGVARAIGMKRGQLVRAYYFEGLAYSAGSALLGTLLGVVVGWGMIQGFGVLFGGSGGVTAQAVVQSFSFTTQSLVTAYTAGFLLTLATVTISAAYVSRMNIVRAIRSQPELVHAKRSRRFLLALGVLVGLLGALLFLAGRPAGTDIDIGYAGATLLLLAAGMVASGVGLAYRWAFSGSAVALLVFWVSLPLRNDLFPGSHTGTIFVFFQEGVFLILAAVLLYVFNSEDLVRFLTGFFRRGSRNLAPVRLAFAYPSYRRFHSAMTISIFAMVLFTIAAIAVIGNGISAGISTTVTNQSGGYGFFGVSEQPLGNLGNDVANNSTLHDQVSTVVSFYTGGAFMTVNGQGPSFGYSIAAAPTGVPGWQNFYTTNQYSFTSTLNGMSPAQVWSEVENDPSVAVIDGSFQSNFISSFEGGSGHPGANAGDNLTLSLGQGGPTPETVRVIGILSEDTIPIVLINPTLAVQHFGFTTENFFLLTAAPNVNADKLLQQFQFHFISQGLELYDFSQLLASTLNVTSAFINLLEIFVALGLIVGITALGILALRAVVERRVQVGIVRAVGFRRSQVLGSFLLEYSFLALMGIAIGTVMGIVLAYNLYQSIGGFFSFALPYTNLLVVLLVSYALTLLATGIPSLRASRIPPAQAIRYTE